MSNINEVLMVSGKGKYHTNNPNTKNPKDLLTIDWDEIKVLVDTPQDIHKDQAQWLIPSTLPSRVHKTQEDEGEYWLLWGDLDDATTPNLSEVERHVATLTNTCNYEIYNSKSATPERQKARILIPLKNGINGKDWRLFQTIFNDKLEDLNLIPDRSTERCAQVCYLPNRGVLYSSLSKRNNVNFNPTQAWTHELQAKKDEITKQEANLKTKQEQALERRSNLKLDSTTVNANSNNEDQFKQLKSLFNSAYTPHDIMTSKGYDQEGETFRHPNSESGSFSATVRLDDKGVLRVHALSTSDPLYSSGQGAHDAFSVFTVLCHGGIIKDAMKDAGDTLLTIDGESFNKAYQIEYAKKKSEQGTSTPSKEPFQLGKFSLRGDSKEMESKMLEDCYVLDRIAILGQLTVIYAKPNTGKTLLVIWMLIESIKNERIKGSRVYYINADDDYKGLQYKTTLAEKYGFEIMAPNFKEFKASQLQDYMQKMIDDKDAREAVIILDTLKKFTDLMDKKIASEFMKKAREFVSNGGTIIMLAHTNKNRNAEGKAVSGGTSDVIDDADCAFVLDEVSRGQVTKQVFFENIKSRGDVATELAFKYSIEDGKDYQFRLDSIELVNKDESARVKEDREYSKQRNNDQQGIDAITEALQQGINAKTELIKDAQENSGISKNKLLKILARYQGQRNNIFPDIKYLWHEITGDKNKKTYYLNGDFKETTKEEYILGKDGE